LAQDWLISLLKLVAPSLDILVDSMPKRSPIVVACAAAGVVLVSQQAFVPAPKVNHRTQIAGAAGSAAALGAAPAFADSIGDAAKQLSEASYPFLKEVDWNSYVYNIRPGGSASSIDWLKAIDKAIVMGTAMDSELLKKAVLAHANAVPIDAKGVISLADYTAINAAIGRIVASVPESMTMDVYNAFDAIVPKAVPEYMMSKVNEGDAKRAYEAFMVFKDVVKEHPITPTEPGTPSVSPAVLGNIEAAASKLSTLSYPFLKEVDWTSEIFQKPLPGVGAQQVLKAVNKALLMGASMDGKLLKDAAEAHHRAIGTVNAQGVTSATDYEAINAGIGKLIASVPKAQVLDTFKAFAAVTNPVVGNTQFSLVNGADAASAYDAFWKFKDVVAR